MLPRREFIVAGAAAAFAGCRTPAPPAVGGEDVLDVWQRETDAATADLYRLYMRDGDTRGLASLEKLEAAFEKIFREARETKVDTTPAVWSVYNMGYIVKTRESLFSIDLVHRRAAEFAPFLDFELVTHNHGDHFHPGLYGEMNGAGKVVISNFLDNYGAWDWRKKPKERKMGGYTRAKKTFKIKDVEIRTSLIDHNEYLVDFTTAFEVKVGDFILYHSGDGGRGAEPKLETVWGRPDLWLFFPGCGINVAEAVERVRPKRIVFGHLWELGHRTGRLTTPMVRNARAAADPLCADVSVRLWGDRLV
ncbi:MAG: MBL fold metallo-hydrolase [Kiritimatiellae bacterium]|nr:MBL fold metallo-hydrolase [Kiritimatiellia bacterium]